MDDTNVVLGNMEDGLGAGDSSVEVWLMMQLGEIETQVDPPRH